MKTNLEFLMRFSRHTLLLLLCYFLNVSLTYGNEGSYVYSVIGTGAALAISAGVQALGTGANAFAQGKLNKKNRAWQEKMYALQRSDALSDWQMQNAYNSPEQQMARLKAAGLNPNLVYGDGNIQGNNAQDVRSSDVGNPQTAAPNFIGIGEGIQSGMMAYVDMKAKTAQTDNILAQNDQIKEQIRSQQMDNLAKAMTYLSEAKARNAINDQTVKYASSEAAQRLYNLMATGESIDSSAGLNRESALSEQSRRLYIDQQISTEKLKRKIMTDENTRAWIMNSTTVSEAKARITSMVVSNAKTNAEKDAIIEATKTTQYENWLNSGDKQFREWLGNPSRNSTQALEKFLYKGLNIIEGVLNGRQSHNAPRGTKPPPVRGFGR